MEGYKKKKVFVFMALVLATIMLNKCAGKAYAQSPEFCGMSEQDMNACRPSYMKINPVPPSKACCFALAKADIVCFCNNWQSPLLPTYGEMINLFNVKAKQRENAENTNGNMTVKKQTAGELRLNKDVLELKLPKSCNISFPNGKNDLMNFEVTIRPDEGYYQGGTFHFSSQVPSVYPHEPPKVKCKTKVYHPNIDLEGNVCLNILREDWKPVLNINTVIYGLFHLFTQPNYEDPLNQDAAAVLRDNPKMFESNVRRAISGGYVGQTFFPKCSS